ncbi:rhomboid family intramembrane serine protease [Robertkochia solimangrovi]|uniref:rhomboid family intramembrane serine protease n=1 Tax=Robertkochia solimangrovi TaxID=2213046 RepID=UPI00117EDB44|nr:rhomboid family intramembrane serine protease [Robertkochia solimangrovi]TRZ44243.1 rhomboid family intramembrane serine protease [Robertkochia solimangrovi]
MKSSNKRALLNQDDLSFDLSMLLFPLFFTLVMWVVYWAELQFHVYLNDWGIYPRTLKGLRGIIAGPFIHGSLKHLYNNTIPVFVLSFAVIYFYRRICWKVLVYGIFLTGLFTWLFARNAYHIGASGLIYVLVSFIFFKGILAGNFRLVALSLSVVFLYGSLIWYIIPVNDEISWEGHLGGFLSGLILALVLKEGVLQKKKYLWEMEDYNEENDPFMKHFDEDGNFIEFKEEDEEEEASDKPM